MEIITLILLLLFITIFGIVIWKYHIVLTTCFFKHSYIKLLSEIFVLLLTISSFFYSLHSDIFADKTLPDNILTYPVNQIRRNRSAYYQEITYKTDTTIKINDINFAFVIDRTLSGVDKTDESKIEKEDLINNINNKIISDNNGNFEISDILLYKLITSVYSRDRNLFCPVLIYNGIKSSKNVRDKNKERICINKKPTDLWKEYVNHIKNSNNEYTNTDISKIFQLIDTPLIKRGYNNVITIISDFEHEKKTVNLHKLEYAIEEFIEKNNNDSLVLNLVCLEGNFNNDSISMRQTRQLIEKYSHFIDFYEYEQEYLTEKSNDKLSSFITQVPVKDTTQTIVLYYPLSLGKFQNTAKSKVRFLNIPTNTFCLNLKNESRLNGTIYMDVEITNATPKKQFQLIDHPKLAIIDSNKIFLLTVESQNKSDNLFLEISDSSNLTKQRIPIEFKQYLSNDVCYVLIILNSFLIVLLIFLTYFFYCNCKHCYFVRNHEGLKLGSKIILIIPISGTILLVLYAIKIIYTLPFFSIIWLLIIIVFCGFLVRYFLSEAKKLNRKCNELHKKG